VGSPSRPGNRSGEEAKPPSQKIVLLFDLKMLHFGAALKRDLEEETRMQLQEEEAIASSYLILATPVALIETYNTT